MRATFSYSTDYIVHNILDAFIGIRCGRKVSSPIRINPKFMSLYDSIKDLLPEFSNLHKDKNELEFLNDKSSIIDLAKVKLNSELKEILDFVRHISKELEGLYSKLGQQIVSDLETFFSASMPEAVNVILVYSPTERTATDRGGRGVTLDKNTILLEVAPERNAQQMFCILVHEFVHLLGKNNDNFINQAFAALNIKYYQSAEELIARLLAPQGILTRKYNLAPVVLEDAFYDELLLLAKDRLLQKVDFNTFCKNVALKIQGSEEWENLLARFKC
jgi:hypothetical protein